MDTHEPVVCMTHDDVAKVAISMKTFAIADAHTEKPEYSKDEAEAYERAKAPGMEEFVRKSPMIRCLLLRGILPVTVALTFDAWKEPPSWNLSMSIPASPKIERVPDQLANVLAGIFFGEGFSEIPHEGSLPEIRQFIKPVEKGFADLVGKKE